MSRYGRISEADDLDRYYSPSWPVELLLEELDPDVWGPTIAEPCAGEGAIVDVLEEHGCDTRAGDIDPESPYPQVDTTAEEALERYEHCDSVITNPPYSAATGTAFEVLDNLLCLGVPVAMLLRLSFLEPPAKGDRKACYRERDSARRPDQVLILPRVQYSGPKGGDSNPATSCWIIWRPDSPLAPHIDTTIRWWTADDQSRVEGQEGLL